MIYIAHLLKYAKFPITRKNYAFVAKIVNTRLAKVFWSFLPSPKGCQLLPPWLAHLEPRWLVGLLLVVAVLTIEHLPSSRKKMITFVQMRGVEN